MERRLIRSSGVKLRAKNPEQAGKKGSTLRKPIQLVLAVLGLKTKYYEFKVVGRLYAGSSMMRGIIERGIIDFGSSIMPASSKRRFLINFHSRQLICVSLGASLKVTYYANFQLLVFDL